MTVKLDKTPPTISAGRSPAANSFGWNNTDVTVSFVCGDELSGIASCTPPQTVTGEGANQSVVGTAVDEAGNSATDPATVSIDKASPTIGAVPDRAPNRNGWYNADVTVSFTCGDALSGIPAGGCPAAQLLREGANQSATGSALDAAGNTASHGLTGINIDKTAPALSGAASTSPNGNGWYNGEVSVAWVCGDNLSGIDGGICPASSPVTGEGDNLSASASIADRAGNRTSTTVSGLKIDRTAPSITGGVVNADGTPRSANAAGWFNSGIRVAFTCDDALSGVANCASDVVLSGDGAHQSATGIATDYADNSHSATVGGLHIDSQAPQTTADISCTSANGWCRGQMATVLLSAADQVGLSGVKEIRYSVNGGRVQTAQGASASVTVPLAARSGLATVRFYAVDNADNSEPMNGVSLKYDNIAPTVSHTLTPVANAAGWNRSNVTVHFDATDDSDGSGVDQATGTPDVTVSLETTGQLVTGEASDQAGNKGTDSVTVKLDRTPPTISGAATTSPNVNGWYSGPVSVKFACADAMAGIATCTGDSAGVTLTANGSGQVVTGTAVDQAGNSASFTVSDLNIESVKPEITIDGVADGAIYTLGAVPAASCTVTDSGSGPAGSCSGTLSGGTANGVGSFTYLATATDLAGNTVTKSVSYRVIYRWNGFLQPINDSAHQTGTSTSVFKATSTVPAKFQLKRADGSVLQANSLPQWLTPAKGSATTATVDESLYGDQATSGSTYRWDSTSQQYIYNWGTTKTQANYYWRIGVQLDDGQIYHVNVGLR